MNFDKYFRVLIKSENCEGKEVPAIILADYIRSIQNITYITGDYIYKNNYRSGGNFPKKVKDSCKLIFKELKLGSIDATITIQQTNSTLFPEEEPVEGKIFDLTKEVIKTINYERNINEKLFDILPDEFRTNRILKEIDSVWPGKNSGYSIEMAYGWDEIIKFSPERKEVIQKAKNIRPMRYSGDLYGRIIDVRVDNRQKFEIDSTIGIVEGNYHTIQESKFKELLGHFVRISGMIEEKGNKVNIIINPEEESVGEIESIPLDKLTSFPDENMNLSYPLDVTVEWDNEESEYILTNDEFSLLGVAGNLKDAMAEIEVGVQFLYDEYLLEDDKKLTNKAIELKKRIAVLFGVE
ncbi:hypothetical protein [Methanoplanus limicola]|uniref:Uncharacterized protein n=1 Tax=Methanoplanus limicola DSM 2279 TaxID=937775 RepID=H1YZG4_9EURY|nr:hypothetical protein [Methanoplanus limicola]EHQ36073.1 hypothetical protein Metlim_1984 [Methanoplanus limicola DSM 2279]